MIRRPCVRVAVLALCAACNFDPSALGGGGSNGGIGGDHGDASAVTGEDAMSLLDGAPSYDAQPACAAACPGSCEGSVCHIFCGGTGNEILPDEGGGGYPACDAVVCPPDLDCYVHCIGTDSCQQPIDCTQSSSCRIDCTSDRACASRLTCGAGLCEIHCDGKDSCGGGLNCQSSCFCDMSCSGESSCNQQATCPAGCDADPDCKTSGSGCASSC